MSENIWYLAFDSDTDYKVVANYLDSIGRSEGDISSLKCPDDQERAAFIVPYDVVSKARTVTVGKRKLNFHVLRRQTSGSKLEFWPPGPKPKPPAPQRESRPKAAVPKKDSDPPPF